MVHDRDGVPNLSALCFYCTAVLVSKMTLLSPRTYEEVYGLWPVSSVSVGLLCGLTCLSVCLKISKFPCLVVAAAGRHSGADPRHRRGSGCVQWLRRCWVECQPS